MNMSGSMLTYVCTHYEQFLTFNLYIYTMICDMLLSVVSDVLKHGKHYVDYAQSVMIVA